jgi:hypothetical protein
MKEGNCRQPTYTYCTSHPDSNSEKFGFGSVFIESGSGSRLYDESGSRSRFSVSKSSKILILRKAIFVILGFRKNVVI